MKKEKIEKTILRISFIAALIFATVELFMAIKTRSQSVLMDATYDAAEVIIIGLTIFLTPLFYKPYDEKRPFGYSQVESVFVAIKVFMLIAVTVALAVNNIQVAISGGNIVDGKIISIFQMILASTSIIIYLLLKKMNKKITSPTIDTEIYSWKLDCFYSIGMAIAFASTIFLEQTALKPLVPYFDQIIAIGISLFMIPEAITTLVKAIRTTFLFAPEKEVTDKMKRIIKKELKSYSYEVVFYDIISTGRKYWISVYFKTKEEIIKRKELEEVTIKINIELKKYFEYCNFELILDV
ncbi:MAG: cation transporter [Bacilli bacterium]